MPLGLILVLLLEINVTLHFHLKPSYGHLAKPEINIVGLFFLNMLIFLFKSQTAREAVLENGVQICSLHINNQGPREFILFTLLIEVLFKTVIQHVELSFIIIDETLNNLIFG